MSGTRGTTVNTVCRAPLAQRRQTLLVVSLRDAGGSRTHFKLLCRQPPCRLAPASIRKCPRQESNLVFDLRRVACESGTPRGQRLSFSTSPRSRTPSCRFEVCRAHPSHSQGEVARPGIEPGLAASEAGVRSGTLTGQMFQYLDLESNQDLNFRTVPCGPLHYRDMEPTAGFAPASIGLQNRCLSVRPRRQARARGFEPRPPVLEAGCSPRSTLV